LSCAPHRPPGRRGTPERLPPLTRWQKERLRAWLELRALSSGHGRRTTEGGIRLEADVLPYLEQFEVTEE